MSAVPSLKVVELIERSRTTPRATLAEMLGPFVLVGVEDETDEEEWSFATKGLNLDELDDTPYSLIGSVVHALVKRTETFPETILVGRASSNDVQIDDPSVSKLHARVRLEEGSFWVEDAGSRNGTFVGSIACEGPSQVYSGDKLCFGNRSYKVHGTTRFCDLLVKLAESRP